MGILHDTHQVKYLKNGWQERGHTGFKDEAQGLCYSGTYGDKYWHGRMGRIISKELKGRNMPFVIAVKKTDGELIVSLPSDTAMKADDILVVLGKEDKLIVLEQMAGMGERSF